MPPKTIDREISPPASKKRRHPLDSPERPALETPIKGKELSIYSWNINGIEQCIQPKVDSYFNPIGTHKSEADKASSSLREFLRRHDWPTLLFLQEVKINPDDSATKHAVEKAVRRQSGEPGDAYDYEAHICLPSDRFNARGFGRKVYGVCSIIRKDFKGCYVDRVRTVEWDTEGRVLAIETKASDDLPKLAIFNVYMVNGTDNPYKDAETGIVIGTRHDRKLAVHALLQEECRKLEEDGFGIIIAGDINIARSRIDGHPNLRIFPQQHCVNRADFETRFFESVNETGEGNNPLSDNGLGMIDSFRQLHPDKKGYTFYPRTRTFGESCDRIDMILLSKSLESNLRSAGMHESASERGTSDHVPLWCRLEFGGEGGSKKSKKV
jgi:exonuclease III